MRGVEKRLLETPNLSCRGEHRQPLTWGVVAEVPGVVMLTCLDEGASHSTMQCKQASSPPEGLLVTCQVSSPTCSDRPSMFMLYCRSSLPTLAMSFMALCPGPGLARLASA